MFYISIFVGYILYISNFFIREMRRKGTEARTMQRGVYDKGSSILLYSLMVFTLLTPGFHFIHFGTIQLPTYFLFLGIGSMVIGIYFHHWSIYSLGKYYSRTLRVQKEHQLVREGPYKIIRHPGYTGSLLIQIGFAILTQNIISSTLIIVLSMVFYQYRIFLEEQMLIKAFGSQYINYQRESWQLIPFII